MKRSISITKIQLEKKSNTINLVQGPRRPQGENVSKDLTKKELSHIMIH